MGKTGIREEYREKNWHAHIQKLKKEVQHCHISFVKRDPEAREKILELRMKVRKEYEHNFKKLERATTSVEKIRYKRREVALNELSKQLVYLGKFYSNLERKMEIMQALYNIGI